MVNLVARRLVAAWKTRLLLLTESEYAMTNVVLPSRDKDKIRRMQEELDNNNNIYIVCGEIDGVHYVRISGQIYLEVCCCCCIETMVLHYYYVFKAGRLPTTRNSCARTFEMKL